MQNPETGHFVSAESEEALRRMRDELLADPNLPTPLQDKRKFPIFRNGETVRVINGDGEEAYCAVESMGRSKMVLRGIPRPRNTG